MTWQCFCPTPLRGSFFYIATGGLHHRLFPSALWAAAGGDRTALAERYFVELSFDDGFESSRNRSRSRGRARQHARSEPDWLCVRSPEISLGSSNPTMARLHEYQGKAILAENGF